MKQELDGNQMVKDSNRYVVKGPRHELVDIHAGFSELQETTSYRGTCTGTGVIDIVLIQYSKERGIKPVVLQD